MCSKHRFNVQLESHVLSDSGDVISELGHLVHVERFESSGYPVNCALRKPFFVSRADIDPGWGEVGFRKVRDNPLVIAFVAEAETFPVRARYYQRPASTSKIPRPWIAGRRGVHTRDGLDFIRVDSLILDNHADSRHPG